MITTMALYYFISIAIITDGITGENLPKSVQTKNLVLYSAVITLILVKYLSALLCKNKLSFGTRVIWFVIEVPIVAILCLVNKLNLVLVLVGILLCVGSTGSLLVFEPLKLHLTLVSLGITLKEKIARLNELPLHYTHDPIVDSTCCQKFGNFVNFFFCSKQPSSLI